jgi:hypothetical protein
LCVLQNESIQGSLPLGSLESGLLAHANPLVNVNRP